MPDTHTQKWRQIAEWRRQIDERHGDITHHLSDVRAAEFARHFGWLPLPPEDFRDTSLARALR